MVLENYPAQALKKQLIEIFKKHLPAANYRIFFFGSRVMGNHRPTSDIDVGVTGPEPIPVNILGEIKAEVENLTILYKIDIVDFSQVPEDFKKVVGKDIEYL